MEGRHVVELLESVRDISIDLLTSPRLREWTCGDIEQAHTSNELTDALAMLKQAEYSLKEFRQLLDKNGNVEELVLESVPSNKEAVETNTTESCAPCSISNTPPQNKFLSPPSPQIFSPPPPLPDEDSPNSSDSHVLPINEQVPSAAAIHSEPTNQPETSKQSVDTHEESFEGDELFADFDSLVMEIDDVELSQSNHTNDEESSSSRGDDVVILSDQEEERLVTVQEIADDQNKDVFDEAVLGCPPPSQEHSDKLKQCFGHSRFKPEQWRVIHSILYGHKDNCAVMATGFGKSLLYQYPAVYTNKLSIVVSPLISLMEDQVAQLNVKNIPACFLGSAQTNSYSLMKQRLRNGYYRILYVTPEFITARKDILTELHSQVGVVMVAIDEAHCVSQWGHDFRDAYRQLSCIHSVLPKVPLLAVTATATLEVRRDICSSLNLISPLMTCTSFDRPNLYLEVNTKSPSPADDFKRLMKPTTNRSTNRVTYSFDGPTIVYCRKRVTTEEITRVLKQLGVSCDMYHAGMSNTTRTQVHHRFLRDEIQCVVATIAFGMGIDKPDVRRIVHFGAPQDIECYYQEIGRAGRDGSSSRCYVFYEEADFGLNKFFLKEISDEKFWKHKNEMLQKLTIYLSSSECRRRMLLQHFNKNFTGDIGGRDTCCDNCYRKLHNVHSHTQTTPTSYSAEAKLLLGIIKETGGRYGLGMPILILKGSQAQKVPAKYKSKKNAFHGQGNKHSEKWWKEFARILISKRFLSEEKVSHGGFGASVQLSYAGESWLSAANRNPAHAIDITPTNQMLALERQPPPASFPGLNRSVTAAAVSSNAPLSQVPLSQVPLSQAASSYNAESVIIPTVEQPSAYKTVLVESTVATVYPAVPVVSKEVLALETELFEQLIVFRNELAHKMDIPPFYISSNKLLSDLAHLRPSQTSAMLKMEGVSTQWVEKFGHHLLPQIDQFCQSHAELSRDVLPDDQPDSGSVVKRIYAGMMWILPSFLTTGTTGAAQSANWTGSRQIPVRTRTSIVSQLKPATMAYYQMCQTMTAEAAAKQKGVVYTTVLGHLSQALEAGYFVDYRKYGLTEELEQLIVATIRKEPISSDVSVLSRIKELLPDTVDYWHIKMTIAILMVSTGFVRNATTPQLNSLTLSSPPSLSQPSPSSYSSSQGKSTGTNKRKLPSFSGGNGKSAKKKPVKYLY